MHRRLRKKIKELERTLSDERRACSEVIDQRDRAQDALQETHIALGGDGEWCGWLPPEPAPNSGDLHIDVPELARELRTYAEGLAKPAAELLAVIDSAYAGEPLTRSMHVGDMPTSTAPDTARMVAQLRAALAVSIPADSSQPECNPTLTECPRCKNDVSKCDGTFAGRQAEIAKRRDSPHEIGVKPPEGLDAVMNAPFTFDPARDSTLQRCRDLAAALEGAMTWVNFYHDAPAEAMKARAKELLERHRICDKKEGR